MLGADGWVSWVSGSSGPRRKPQRKRRAEGNQPVGRRSCWHCRWGEPTSPDRHTRLARPMKNIHQLLGAHAKKSRSKNDLVQEYCCTREQPSTLSSRIIPESRLCQSIAMDKRSESCAGRYGRWGLPSFPIIFVVKQFSLYILSMEELPMLSKSQEAGTSSVTDIL